MPARSGARLLAIVLSVSVSVATAAVTQLVDPVTASAGPPSGALGPPDFQAAYHLPKWTSSSLPVNLYGASTVAADGYIFVIGGYGGTGPVSTVYSAAVNVNGSLGTWGSTVSLPQALYYAAAATYNGYIFVVGGNNGSSAVNTVYSGQVTSAGTIISWTNLTNTPLQQSLFQHVAAAANGSLIVAGGTTIGSPYNPQSAVYTAAVNSNGTLGAWSSGPSLPTALRLHSAAIAISGSNSYLVVGGGRDSSNVRQDLVYTAAISTGGALSGFVQQSPLDSFPVPVDGQAMVAVGKNLVVIGGTTASGVSSAIYHAPISSDGTVGAADCRTNGTAECWLTSYYSLPQVRAGLGAVTVFGVLVTTAGYDASTSPTNSVYNAPFNVVSGTVANGSPATVAVVDAFDVNGQSGQVEADLQIYRSFYGLPPCTTANGCFKVVKSGNPGPPPPTPPTWRYEGSLDPQMVSASCPNCHILFVEAQDNSYTQLGLAQNVAAGYGSTDPDFTPTAISDSIVGHPGPSDPTEAFMDANYWNHPGIAQTAASGDFGYCASSCTGGAGANYPSESPNVISVGGTLLKPGTGGSYTESVWLWSTNCINPNDGTRTTCASASGCSAVENEPAWQVGVTDAACSRRMVADVAAAADGNSHIAMYDSSSYWGNVNWAVPGYGTSAASPLVAGIIALAGTGGSTSYPSFIYANRTGLNDITTGNNIRSAGCGSSGSATYYLCHARTGYDGPSGLGTPNGISAFGPPAYGKTWVQQSPNSSPSPRGMANMAYDSATGTAVLFGGWDNSGTYLNDTWTWNGNTWNHLSPPTSPPARADAAVAYDAATATVVMFGGHGSTTWLNDTWSWNGTTWSQLSPTHSPSARQGSGVAYYAAGNEVLLFGGWNGSQQVGDTWTWNGSDWTQPGGAAPAAREWPAMTYDPVNRVAVLFGGEDATPALRNDTWTWNGAGWTQANPVTTPSARAGAGLDYDATIGAALMFGGTDNIFSGTYSNETWSWNGTTWTQQSPAVSPPARGNFPLTFFPPSGAVVICGGFGTPPTGSFWGDTWDY